MANRERHIYTVIIGSIDHSKVYGTHESSSLDAAVVWVKKQSRYIDYSVSIYRDADEVPINTFEIHSDGDTFRQESLNFDGFENN